MDSAALDNGIYWGASVNTHLVRDSSEVSAKSGEPETVGGSYSTRSSSAALRGKWLCPLYAHIRGVFGDWLAASMIMSSSFSESSWSRQDSISSLNSSQQSYFANSLNVSRRVATVTTRGRVPPMYICKYSMRHCTANVLFDSKYVQKM